MNKEMTPVLEALLVAALAGTLALAEPSCDSRKEREVSKATEAAQVAEP